MTIRYGTSTGIKYTDRDMTKCKLCGRKYVLLASHVWQSHDGILGREYRKKFGYDVKKGLSKGKFLKLKKKLALKNVDFEKLKTSGESFLFKDKDSRAGNYIRSFQTIRRLKKLKYLNPLFGRHKIVNCFYCGKEFKKYLSNIVNGWRNFCSNCCKIKYRKKFGLKKKK